MQNVTPSYSKEDLNTAVENVKSGRMTLYRAAKLYKITTATLFNPLNAELNPICWHYWEVTIFSTLSG